MTVNENLRNEAIKHAIFSARFSNGAVKRMLKILDESNRKIIKRMQTANLPGARTPAQRKKLNSLTKGINKIITAGNKQLMGSLTGELRELSDYEAVQFVKQINGAAIAVNVRATTPALATLYATSMARPMHGKLMREWFKELSAGKGRAVRQAILRGAVEGQTMPEIIRAVKGTRAALYKDGVLGTYNRHAATAVRTSISHVMTNARKQVLNGNTDLIKGWQYVATLDGRTTDICASLDGKVFKVKEDAPTPPQHMNCRSTIAPITKSWRELGIDKDELPAGTRASMNGQVPAKQTYREWLTKQPAKFQDSVLGKKKGILFRKGNLPIERFYDKSGSAYTLEQLKQRESGAWNKAFGKKAKPKAKPKRATPVKTAPPKKVVVTDKTTELFANEMKTVMGNNFHKSLTRSFVLTETDKLHDAVIAAGSQFGGVYPEGLLVRTKTGKMIRRSGGFYVPSQKKISMKGERINTKGGEWTLRHEFGHHMDNVAPRPVTTMRPRYASNLKQEIIDKEMGTLVKRKTEQKAIKRLDEIGHGFGNDRTVRLNEYATKQFKKLGVADKWLDDLELTNAERHRLAVAIETGDPSDFFHHYISRSYGYTNVTRDELRKTMRLADDYGGAKIADYFSSLSTNHIVPSGGPKHWGHPTEYLRASGGLGPTEGFANYVAARGAPDQTWYRLMRHWSPEITDAFDDILQTLAKDKKHIVKFMTAMRE